MSDYHIGGLAPHSHLSDVASATSADAFNTGTWQTSDLSITRTTTLPRRALIITGYDMVCGGTAGNFSIRIYVDGDISVTTRTIRCEASRSSYLHTFHCLEIAAGAHTIRMRYYATQAGTMSERELAVIWLPASV